jgi:hypothetical protein
LPAVENILGCQGITKHSGSPWPFSG